MRAKWEAHYASLRKFVSALQAAREFKKLNPLFPASFPEPVALIEHLSSSRDLEQIDAIYRVLVEAAQQGSHFAHAALWLGLWNGLDAIFRRWIRRYAEDSELVADIGAMFTMAVSAADLRGIKQVPATLIRNTERRLSHRRKRENQRTDLQDELPQKTLPANLRAEAPDDSALGMRLALADEHGAVEVSHWVRQQLPAHDAELIIETMVNGESQKDFADRVGRTPVAVRKQHQRALRTLSELSHFAGKGRVYRDRRNQPPVRRARRE